MNKKGFGLITLVIVAVAALIIGLFAASSFAQLSPPLSISKNFVNAHACRADGVCEVNNLKSAGEVMGDTGDFSILETIDLMASDLRTDELLVNGITTITSILNIGPENPNVYPKVQIVPSELGLWNNGPLGDASARMFINSEGNFEIETGGAGPSREIVFKTAGFPDGDIIFTSDAGIRVKNLSGSGTSYVCVDSVGTLIRSQTPCV